jgi:hypothetical protein
MQLKSRHDDERVAQLINNVDGNCFYRGAEDPKGILLFRYFEAISVYYAWVCTFIGFLMVYVSDAMRKIAARYAPLCLLLDATYQTSKYPCPVFQVGTQTNCGYQVHVRQQDKKGFLSRVI